MAKIASIVRQINRRLADLYDTFGVKSTEYAKAKSILFSAFNRQAIMEGLEIVTLARQDKPMQLSRSNKAMFAYENVLEFTSALADTWEELKEMGTAKAIMKEYKANLERTFESQEEEEEFIRRQSDLRRMSELQYAESFLDTDYYVEVNDEINENAMEGDEEYAKSLAEAMSIFKETGTKREDKWNRVRSILIEAKIKHQEWLAGEMRHTDSPHDMGGNPWDMSKRR